MAFPTTYAGWLAYIRDWLSADEYSEAQIGSFLDLAQLRLNREMESYHMEGRAPIVTIDLNPINILSVVPDFNKVRLVSVYDWGPLDVLSIGEIKKLWMNEGALGYHRNPYIRGYAIDAGELYISPIWGVGETIDFLYYKEIPPLSTSVPTNVFSLKHQDALLYASLLAGAPYMRDNEDIKIWEEQYAMALMTGNESSKHIKMGSSPLVREMRIR